MKKRVFLILIGILALLAVSVCSSFAQEIIDLSGMDKDQLIQLLESVKRKLESGGPDAPGDDLDPEASAAEVSAIGENDPESVSDIGRFSVYLNKKLLLEPLPDYYFIRPQTGHSGNDDQSDPETPGKKTNSGDDGKSEPGTPVRESNPGDGGRSDSGTLVKETTHEDNCSDKCHNSCPFSDYECVWSCLANCSD